MNTENLKIENLCVGYKNINILNDITFSIGMGEMVGIIGPNGAGKSTLLKAITSVLQPKKGVVLLNKKDIGKIDRKEIARTMAVVPQNTLISPMFTVYDMVSMGRYPHIKDRFSPFDGAEDIKIVNDSMKMVGVEHLSEKTLDAVSGGERQMAVIARALAQQPKILILDEPTSNLDINHQIKILKLVKNISRDKNISVIIVIHDLNTAARFCDKLILLHNKKILAIGTPEEVLTIENIMKAYKVEAEVNYSDTINSMNIIVLDELDGKLDDD
ncbi:ABC transporter related protein [groundwater metagenome]|uniref:ABC transporter related protein n=1 Tax=groundwater metagenome TaxID=717931 RepID=A0A098E6Y7_9ZZZZ